MNRKQEKQKKDRATNKKDHAFSEELSDSPIRDEIIRKQTSKG
ncbi:hypothetical protein [Virgibacillus necropolis]|nr:hypothetical protein [Virgibacillus necropolis]